MFGIAVIIPSWNRAHLITNALDSVLAQSCLPDEIIVVDDGSTDNTRDIIQTGYPMVKLISQENKGVSAARNTGITSTTHEWIALLDSDDKWQPQKLEKQCQQLAMHPDYLICHTNETWIRRGRYVNQMKKHQKKGGHIFQHCLPLCAISPSSVMIHRRIFNDVGLFDETLPACEDYDLWLRITARYPVLYLEEELITKYGGHDDQLSRQYWGMDRYRIYSLAKIIADHKLDIEDKNVAIKIMLKKIRIYLAGAKKYNNTEHVHYFNTLLEQYEPIEEELSVATT